MDLHLLSRENRLEQIRTSVWSAEQLNAFDACGYTPLMYAAMRGHHGVCLALKEMGADVDLKDVDGLKAVDHGARHGHGMVIISLIEGGCGG